MTSTIEIAKSYREMRTVHPRARDAAHGRGPQPGERISLQWTGRCSGISCSRAAFLGSPGDAGPNGAVVEKIEVKPLEGVPQPSATRMRRFEQHRRALPLPAQQHLPVDADPRGTWRTGSLRGA